MPQRVSEGFFPLVYVVLNQSYFFVACSVIPADLNGRLLRVKIQKDGFGPTTRHNRRSAREVDPQKSSDAFAAPAKILCTNQRLFIL